MSMYIHDEIMTIHIRNQRTPLLHSPYLYTAEDVSFVYELIGQMSEVIQLAGVRWSVSVPMVGWWWWGGGVVGWGGGVITRYPVPPATLVQRHHHLTSHDILPLLLLLLY